MAKFGRSWSLRRRPTVRFRTGETVSEEFTSVILDADATRWDRLKVRIRYLLRRPPFDRKSGMGRPHFFGEGSGTPHGAGMSPEDTAKFLELGQVFVDMSTSPLVRVVAIGQQAEAAGIRVELIALEVRTVGAVLYWKAFTAEDRWLGDPVIDLTDEKGGQYQLQPASGGGSGRQSHGQIVISPAPPEKGTLLVTISAFGGFSGLRPGFPSFAPTALAEGRWVFEFPLDSQKPTGDIPAR